LDSPVGADTNVISAAHIDGGLQGPDMNVEFLGKLIERQPLVLSRMISADFAGTLQHRRRDGSTPAVPGAESLE
jgi:hypothetical protein